MSEQIKQQAAEETFVTELYTTPKLFSLSMVINQWTEESKERHIKWLWWWNKRQQNVGEENMKWRILVVF